MVNKYYDLADWGSGGTVMYESPPNAYEWYKKMIEREAEKLLCEMIEENSPKLLQFFLSAIARQMEDANATEMDLNCDLDINGERYKIETKSTLKKI